MSLPCGGGHVTGPAPGLGAHLIKGKRGGWGTDRRRRGGCGGGVEGRGWGKGRL